VQQADVHLGRQGGGVKLLDHLYRGAGISGQGLFITNRIRTLVAVAALADFSGAYAQVTISGVVEAAVVADGTTTTLGNGFNGGSEFTLGLNEDLGNGLNAVGEITLITPAIGASIGAAAGVLPNENGVNTYNSFVGVSGVFGSLKKRQGPTLTRLTNM
jgi:hypothetical protein